MRRPGPPSQTPDDDAGQPRAGRWLQRVLARRLSTEQAHSNVGRTNEQPWTDLPPDVVVERDQPYGGDAHHTLDVYRPADRSAAQSSPLVFMVHGGGWQLGDKAAANVVRHKVLAFVRKGFVLVSVNYRMAPEAPPVQQADDVAMALASVQRQAGPWGIDGQRIVLMGHSSGAHLVALLSADLSISQRHGVLPWRATVALDCAAYDVEAVMSRPHFRFYDTAFGRDPGQWRDASPMARLTSRPAMPMLLVCSTLREGSCDAAGAFARRVAGLGGRADVLPVDLDHREINASLGEPGAYTAAVEAFLRSTGFPC